MTKAVPFTEKNKQIHRCLATLEQHILGRELLVQELLLSHTLEVEHPHNRATPEPHLRAIPEPHDLDSQESLQVKDMGEIRHLSSSQEHHLRAIQEPHALDSLEPLQVKDMGELRHLSSRAILVVVQILVMEEPHPHSLATVHNLSKDILVLHPPNTRARVMVLPLSSNRYKGTS